MLYQFDNKAFFISLVSNDLGLISGIFYYLKFIVFYYLQLTINYIFVIAGILTSLKPFSNTIFVAYTIAKLFILTTPLSIIRLLV